MLRTAQVTTVAGSAEGLSLERYLLPIVFCCSFSLNRTHAFDGGHGVGPRRRDLCPRPLFSSTVCPSCLPAFAAKLHMGESLPGSLLQRKDTKCHLTKFEE